jgi:hypothetical protein
MIHLQIMAPSDRTARVLEVLDGSSSATNVVVLRGGRRPKGDVVFPDVAREEASDVISDLRDLGIERDGSIRVGQAETEISRFVAGAELAAPPGWNSLAGMSTIVMKLVVIR